MASRIGSDGARPACAVAEGEEETDLPKALDAGNDDYYAADVPGCLDFEESPYLTLERG